MSRKCFIPLVAASFFGGAASADVPRVAVDIVPLHSLVARVMEGVGTPDLVIRPGASPHEYSLRPSEARTLQEAELIFWIGSDLTPWLDESIATLAPGATAIGLLEREETRLLSFREGALFEAHEHDHGAEDEHGHEEHDAHGHEGHDHEKHDDHASKGHEDHKEEAHEHDHAATEGHGHDHGEEDPHAWLSPRNAAIWLAIIGEELATADPLNAEAYRTNAETAAMEMTELMNEVSATLDPVRDGKFIVFHDAYQYFETDFALPASGAISIGDASDPSPARIAEIRAVIRDEGIDCVLSEPQFNPGLVETVMDGTEATVGVIDPIGVDLALGSDLYPQLIRNMAQTLADCL